MKAMVVKTPKEPLVLEERDVPEPGAGEARVTVEACGICHSDRFVTEGLWPELELPRVPGHEAVGVVDALGEGVRHLAVGDRVGLGWHGGHDGTCPACLKGKFLHCDNGRITGLTIDGGYAEYLVAPSVALARVPDGMKAVEVGPLLCAGVTTFNALRNSGARPGDRVGIQGLGGLGHLGVQYARAMGFEVIAISRGADKEAFARALGAHHFVDTNQGAAEQLQALGGADLILATAPNAKAMAEVVPGLAIDGCLMVVGAPFEPIAVGAIDLISREARVQGWASGTATDSTDAIAFAKLHGVRTMTEVYPLAEANAAIERMMSGQARFRVVLDVAAD